MNNFVCEPLDGPKMRVDYKEKVEDDEKSTEFKKEYKMVQWRAFPAGKGFSIWDKVVINKGDITFADLIKELETMFPGLKVEAIFKRVRFGIVRFCVAPLAFVLILLPLVCVEHHQERGGRRSRYQSVVRAEPVLGSVQERDCPSAYHHSRRPQSRSAA